MRSSIGSASLQAVTYLILALNLLRLSASLKKISDVVRCGQERRPIETEYLGFDLTYSSAVIFFDWVSARSLASAQLAANCRSASIEGLVFSKIGLVTTLPLPHAFHASCFTNICSSCRTSTSLPMMLGGRSAGIVIGI